MSKAREHQQLQKSQHIHIQQLMLQRQAQQQQQQQQRRDGGQLINSNTNGITSADPLIRPNTGSANALATKMYEDKLKLSQASEDIKVILDTLNRLCDFHLSQIKVVGES